MARRSRWIDPRELNAEVKGVNRRPIEQVLAAHNESLLSVSGVVGTAIGLCNDAPCIRVFVVSADVGRRHRFPATLEGYRVTIEVTGPMHAREDEA